LALFAALGWPAEPMAAETAPAPIDFARDIRPLFAKHCHACHGPKEEEGGLRLDLRSRAMEGGASGPPLVKGRAADSLLYQFVTGKNEDKILMPPKGQGERLDEADCERIRRWIDEGAVWPDDVAGGADAVPAAIGRCRPHAFDRCRPQCTARE
jgi:mono/diheme cytochrome c family protein